ncbi:MAG: adenylate/guanylate cyclase domain-containing protein [Xanthobacteraceae bacterium]|nr:adenylate/guanylate cyclase domain-containing protein [Xanthobacteraceae bacterium]
MVVRAGRFYVLLVGGILAAAIFIRYIDPFVVQSLRLIAFDIYQRLAPQTYDPNLPVRIVDIDEKSLATIGQWPWPRTMIADLVSKLGASGAAAIAFDMQFSEPDRTSLEQVAKYLPDDQKVILSQAIAGRLTNDEQFAAALKKTPSVLAVALANDAVPFSSKRKAGFAIAGDDPRPFVAGFSSGAGNLEMLEQAASGIGSINWVPDRDQVVRRVALVYRAGDTLVPSVFAEALRVAQGATTYVLKASNASGETAFGRSSGLNHIRIGGLEIPTDADGGIWLKFRKTRPDTFIPAWKLLAGEVAPEEISGRIIFIGTSAAGLLDLRATPLDAALPGVEVHVQAIEHILSGRSLTRPDYALALEEFIIVVFGVLLAFVLVKVSARTAALLGLFAIESLFAGGWLAYDYGGLLLDPIYPALALLCLVAAATFYVYRRIEVQRAEIRGAFSRYVAPAVVNELLANPEKLELGGEVRELTLLFCDVRNFTTISERLSASELTHFINELLTPLSEIILQHRGTIDKYMGDAIMAFWNAPLDEPDHAVQACRSALDMAAGMGELNRRWQEEAKASGRAFEQVRIGIGINTGNCCVGNLGSTQRFDYSAIGDEVNVASRFEGLSKFYGLTAILGERTVRESPGFPALELDLVRVKGRGKPTPIYTFCKLLDEEEGRISRLQSSHGRFLAAFRGQQWDTAEAAVAECRSIGIAGLEPYYSVFSSRIAAYRDAPPPKDWDGAFTAHEK